MAGGASAAKSSSTTGVRIVVVGDRATGKSSLIITAAAEAFPANVPPVLPPTRLPEDMFPDRVPVTVIDTSSSLENRGKLADELKRADAVVLTYACDQPSTLDRLSTFWLPELRRLEVKVPVIVAGCKLDLRDEQQPVSLEQVMSPIMQQFREIETCIECSAYKHIQIPEVFYYAQKAVLHPTAPLFDQEAQTLKPRCVRALKRIFILCDNDRDGALSDAELNDFQVKCFNAPLQPSEIVGVKRVVQEKLPEGVNENGLTLTGFLFLHALFIEKGRLETTWTVLRKFGYNNDIRLNDDQLLPPIKTTPDQSVELTSEAMEFLKGVFSLFDSDGDGALNAPELEDLFSTAPESPWSEAPFAIAAERNALGGLSLDGFLSKWALMTLLNPVISVENLIYIGYAGDPSSAVKVTRRRRVDRKKQQSERSVFQCFVFGPKEAGKSELLHAFVGRPFSEIYTPTPATEERYTVNVVDQSVGTKKTLILREIPEDAVGKLLIHKEALAACDIAVFVHDSSNEASWTKATELLVQVASHGESTGYEVPCLIVAAKDDLEPFPTAIQDSITLNVNGLGRGEYKSPWISNIISKHNICFVGIQESKRKDLSDMDIKRIWGSNDFDYVLKGSLGKSGGLISIWNKNLFRKSQCLLRQDSIIVKGTWIESGESLCFINIYASQSRESRVELWSYISAVIRSWKVQTVIIGDFNEVRNESERRGSIFDKTGAAELDRFIKTNDLEDLKIGGKNYTWYNKKCTKMSRLDRVLISKDMGDNWTNLEVIAESRRFSDHSPLILKQITRNYGPIPFNFYNSWLMEEDFMELVTKAWDNFHLDGDHLKLYYLMKKMKFVKSEIVMWEKLKRKLKERKKKENLKTIEEVDKRIDLGTNSEQDILDREKALEALWNLEKQEHEVNKQKYKNRWCLEGDENSKLFHRNLNKKKRKAGIKGIMKDGNWNTEPNLVKNIFFEHFRDRFKRDEEDSWTQDLSSIKRLNEDQRNHIERPFSEEEIKHAVWECGTEKSPGPDGFNIEFIKSCWMIVKDDILEAIQEFSTTARIPRGCNSAFISLIPKKLDATEVHDYRPISLVGIVFKIISKTLSLRLKNILHFVINPIQSAFVQDRQILDGPMIINEVIDWAKRKKKKVFMFKTDIAKAYDSVSWSYLNKMMEAMNFGPKWRSWIHACLDSSAMSVLVNGSPTSEFRMERGLRQGDPISPFLFTLVMEGLSLAVDKAVETGLFKDLKVGNNSISISHLFFADDAVFIGEWDLDNALSMIGILMCFKKASGLQVNYQKSSLFGIGLDTDSVLSMANLLGCKADKLPAIFLGIPIGSNMGRIEKWRPIAEKFRKKMSTWKARTLSIGGRHTIVSNILGGIPNYWMSMFPVPKGVVKELENMRREFFWGMKEERRSTPWVKWSKVCQQRKNGGLGIIGIEDMNISLLGKWVWRFKKEENALWTQVIRSIHGEQGSMTGEEVKKMHPCIWKNILVKLLKLDNVFLNIPCLLQVDIGNGEDTSFWEDKWHDIGVLKKTFPRLYALELDKKVKAKSRLDNNLEEWDRRRAIRDGREREEAKSLKEVIRSKSLSSNPDVWKIPQAPKGVYSTEWLRGCLETYRTMGQIQQNYWIKWIPKKHNILIWRMIKDRIPVRKKLLEMGIDIPCSLCPICEEKEEDSLHLFFECSLARYLWSKMEEWWSIALPAFSDCTEPFNWAWYNLGNRTEGRWFQVALVAVFVSICRCRNGVIFEKKKVEAAIEFRKVQETAYFWISNRNFKFKMVLLDWISNPRTKM